MVGHDSPFKRGGRSANRTGQSVFFLTSRPEVECHWPNEVLRLRVEDQFGTPLVGQSWQDVFTYDSPGMMKRPAVVCAGVPCAVSCGRNQSNYAPLLITRLFRFTRHPVSFTLALLYLLLLPRKFLSPPQRPF